MFKPAAKLISSITRDYPALVTTVSDHEYKTGLIVRLIIPTACGMQEINGTDESGDLLEITVTGAKTFTVNVDSTFFDAFAVPTTLPDFINICAWVIPVGEGTDYTDSIPTNVT